MFWGRCVCVCVLGLNEAKLKKKTTRKKEGMETNIEREPWRFGGKGEEEEEEEEEEEGECTVSWLCAQRQENKPLKVIRLIHLDNTEASSYRPLPQLYTQTHKHTHIHTFHSFSWQPPSLPPPPATLLLLQPPPAPLRLLKGGRDETSRRRKVRRDKGGRKNSWGSTRGRLRRRGRRATPSSPPPPPPPPLLHLTTTITSNLLRLMASLTDHPRFVFFAGEEKKQKKKTGILLRPHMKKPNQASPQFFQPKIKKLTDLQVLGKIHPGATQVFFLVGSFSSSPLVWVSPRPQRLSLGVMSCQPWVGVQPEAEATGHGGPPAINTSSSPVLRMELTKDTKITWRTNNKAAWMELRPLRCRKS